MRDRWLFIKDTRVPGIRNRKATKNVPTDTVVTAFQFSRNRLRQQDDPWRHIRDSIPVQSEQTETVG